MENTNAQEQVKFTRSMIADIKSIGQLAMRPLRKMKQLEPKIEKMTEEYTASKDMLDKYSKMIEDICGYPLEKVVSFHIDEKTHTMKPVFVEPKDEENIETTTKEESVNNNDIPEGAPIVEAEHDIYSQEEMATMSQE